MAVNAENCFTLEKLVNNAEYDFGQIPPNKYSRIIYGQVMNEQSGSTNKLTLREYDSDGSTLLKEWPYNIGAYDTIPLGWDKETPIYQMAAGHYIKAVASASSVQLSLHCRDL